MLEQDCRDVENLVMNTFGSAGPTALVFYVGHKSEYGARHQKVNVL
jgi:hypothetical protein